MREPEEKESVSGVPGGSEEGDHDSREATPEADSVDGTRDDDARGADRRHGGWGDEGIGGGRAGGTGL